MPRIKRWFPVSHDINADPEVWAMRHQIGEKSLSIWLEFLSIADRNEGELPGDSEELLRLVSGRCQAALRTVTAVYHFALSRMWLSSESPLKVVKWSKYHISREDKKNPTVSLPSEPSEPSESEPLKMQTPAPPAAPLDLPKTEKKKIDPEIKKWGDLVLAVDHAKFAGRLASWIKAAERNYHPQVIASALERFLPYAKQTRDWWPYLDAILDKQEIIHNARNTEKESANYKIQDHDTAQRLGLRSVVK